MSVYLYMCLWEESSNDPNSNDCRNILLQIRTAPSLNMARPGRTEWAWVERTMARSSGVSRHFLIWSSTMARVEHLVYGSSNSSSTPNITLTSSYSYIHPSTHHHSSSHDQPSLNSNGALKVTPNLHSTEVYYIIYSLPRFITDINLMLRVKQE